MARLVPQIPVGAPLASTSELRHLARVLSRYSNVAVLSGAGISTESGLSDYRSPGKLRPPRPPINHSEYVRFANVRQRYWARSFVGYNLLSTASPNIGHLALAALHDRGGATFGSHVTQNVDGLLQAARLPTSRLVELHGSIHWLICHSCWRRESRTSFQERLKLENRQLVTVLDTEYDYRPDGDADVPDRMVEQFKVPACRSCGKNSMMPTVVFHGGTVPTQWAASATRVVEECDALLVVGSTITPYSAFRLVRMAKSHGKLLAAINFGETRGDDLLDIKVEAVVGDAIARLADMLLAGGFQKPKFVNRTLHSLATNVVGGKLQL